MNSQLPVAVVCRVLGAPRSTLYARRHAQQPIRPGPATSISDGELLELIRQVLLASSFAGEGDRKVRARLGREHGVQVSGNRVLRLLRLAGLLASQRARGRRKPRPMTARSSPRRPTGGGAPTPPWPGPGSTAGSGSLPWWITTRPRRGRTWPRSGTALLPPTRLRRGHRPLGPAGCRCRPRHAATP